MMVKVQKLLTHPIIMLSGNHWLLSLATMNVMKQDFTRVIHIQNLYIVKSTIQAV